MRELLAELVSNIAEKQESETQVFIQTEALNIVVAVLVMRLDEVVRVQLKNEINESFASQQTCRSQHADEKKILQSAVEKLFRHQEYR